MPMHVQHERAYISWEAGKDPRQVVVSLPEDRSGL